MTWQLIVAALVLAAAFLGAYLAARHNRKRNL